MEGRQDDSFFGPGAAGSPEDTGATRMRARAWFGLPSDPTRRGGPSQFDEDFDPDETRSYGGIPHLLVPDGDDTMDQDEAIPEREPDDTGVAHTSDVQQQEYDATNVHEQHEQADTTYPESETSSAAFDPDDDPEQWAERLDELAGKLEVSEAEARAVRWGPAIGSQRNGEENLLHCLTKAPRLHHEDLRKLIDHHITTTEWRFNTQSSGMRFAEGLDTNAELHPIRGVARAWVGHQAGEQIDPLSALRQTILESGYAPVNI